MKKLTALLALFLSISVLAQNGLNMPSVDPVGDSLAILRVRARMDSIRQHRPTVAVVLAGGGALGMAHLGVLRYMEEQGIPVDLIGGTSMGGLVSGLYSLGYGERYLDSLVRSIDWTVMMSDKIPDSYQTYKVRRNKERFAISVPWHYEDTDKEARAQRQLRFRKTFEQRDNRSGDMMDEMMSKLGLGMPDGYLFGFNVRNTLSSVSVGYQDSLAFDALPIPFYCVATDMHTMKEKNWTSGNIVDAMRSTMAIPIYFRPVRTEGMVLSDGGTRNNFPVDIARAMGADIVIGSEMPSSRDLSDLGSIVGLAMQNISMMTTESLDKNRAMTDVLLQHKLEGYNMLSFDSESVDDIIARGYALAQEKGEEFAQVARLVGRQETGPKEKTAVDLRYRKVKVGAVRIEGINDREREYLLSPIPLPLDSLYDRSTVENILSTLYGTRAFESVTYRMEGREEPYTLVFDCQKGQTNEFGVSAHVDFDEKVYVGILGGFGTRKLYGPRLTTELKLGTVSSLMADFAYKPIGQLPVFGISAKATYSDFKYQDKGDAARYIGLNTRAEIYAEDARLNYGDVRMGFAMENEPYESYLDNSLEWTGWDWRSRWFSTFADLRYDTFNERYFPTKGFQLALKTRYVFDGFSIYLEGETEGEEDVEAGHTEGKVPPYSVGVAHASVVLPLGSRLALQPSLYAGWMTETPGHMNLVHTLTAGGTLAGRYVENQLPFFGFNTGFWVCQHYAMTAQADLRYRINHKNFVTLRGGVFHDTDHIPDFFKDRLDAYAFGLEIGQKSVAGPMKLGVQWCNRTKFSVALSVGFDF